MIRHETPKGFKWSGYVEWPDPDDFDMPHWDTWRKLNNERFAARDFKNIDKVSEEFVIGMSMTMQHFDYHFEGLDIQDWIDNPEKRKPRFLNWFFHCWNPYIEDILNPKG